MTADDQRLPRPPRARRWNSFVADDPVGDKPARGLHEVGNDKHRLRVEHDAHTLFIHLSDEDGRGWTTIELVNVATGEVLPLPWAFYLRAPSWK